MLFSKRVVIYLTTLLALAASIANAAPTGYDGALEARDPGKTPPKPKPADKAKSSAGSGSKKKTSEPASGPACVRKRDLVRRNGHANPRNPITVYHGTSLQNAQQLQTGAPRIGTAPGDLSYRGGFYITDRLEAAAQYACYKTPGTTPAKVAVLEYTWDPTGLGPNDIYEFPSANDEYREFSQEFNGNINLRLSGQANKPEWAKYQRILDQSSMISAPMTLPGTDKDFTADFWQYAIIKAPVLSRLTYVRTHTVKCKRIAKGELDPDRTAGPSSGFSKGTTDGLKLKDPNAPKKDCIIM